MDTLRTLTRPGPEAVIRQFQPDDAEACLAVIRECIRRDPCLPASSREALLEGETVETIRERGSLYYIVVYETGREIAGIAGVEMNEIRLLFVAPGRQRNGIGGKLLAYLERMVPPALFRDVFAYAAPAAVAFYRRHGYVGRGQQLFEVQGQLLETVFMVKPLP